MRPSSVRAQTVILKSSKPLSGKRQRRTASRSCSIGIRKQNNDDGSACVKPPDNARCGERGLRCTRAHAETAAFPIIDTHLHLYDPTRPQGAPYPKTANPPPFLPRDYRESATPLGITGGIVVEASPWVEDNLWVLMTIEKEPLIVGLVGCLDPTKPDFREYLDRYHRNKLFLGSATAMCGKATTWLPPCKARLLSKT